MCIACPHFSISIRQRSKRQSAIAGAAYQCGEKLFSEYDGKTKSYPYKAGEVLAKGILLPSNALQEYADRQTLWNAVEKAENQWNAQLARGIIIALPNEIPKDEYEALVCEYCHEQFVLHGMIVDYAIHDKGDGNPHAHILLTMRAMDEQGHWLPKARKVYDLDENGERILLPSGEYKSHKENTMDWNDRRYSEVWRTAWAGAVNRYFEKNGIGTRLDLRSYERQGKGKLPTVHLGPAASHMEKKGRQTELGEYNREIEKHNAKLTGLKTARRSLQEWITEVNRKLSDLIEEEHRSPELMDFINAYFDMRKDRRFDWNRYAKQKGTIVDLKQQAKIFNWIQQKGIRTMDDFHAMLQGEQPVLDRIAENEKEIKRLKQHVRYIEMLIRLKPIADKAKTGFKVSREKYAEAHKDELAEFRKAVRYLKSNRLNASDKEKYSAEAERLTAENHRLREQLRLSDSDREIVQQIQYCIDTTLREAEVLEKKASILEKLQVRTESNRTKEGKEGQAR